MNPSAILRGMRTAKAVGVAVPLALFLAWWHFFGNPGPPVATREVPGVVTTVHEKAYTVRLDSGQEVKVFRTLEIEAGARVRLKGTRYASGEESFALDGAGDLVP